MPRMYSQEFRARAVRLLADQINGPDGVAETRAIIDISAKLGVSRESLRRWYRQAQIDQGLAQGRSSEESAELRRLRKENAELRRTNEVLKLASAFFASELGRP